MEARIQFRIDEETKRLAQLAAERKGLTLSDACRQLAETFADEQRKVNEHEGWLKEQVDAAFAKLDSGESVYLSHEQARSEIEKRKNAVRARFLKNTA